MSPITFGLLVFAGMLIGYFLASPSRPFSLTLNRITDANEVADLSWGERLSLAIGVVCMLLGAAVLLSLAYHVVQLIRGTP